MKKKLLDILHLRIAKFLDLTEVLDWLSRWTSGFWLCCRSWFYWRFWSCRWRTWVRWFREIDRKYILINFCLFFIEHDKYNAFHLKRNVKKIKNLIWQTWEYDVIELEFAHTMCKMSIEAHFRKIAFSTVWCW